MFSLELSKISKSKPKPNLFINCRTIPPYCAYHDEKSFFRVHRRRPNQINFQHHLMKF